MGPAAKLKIPRSANLPQFKLSRYFRTAAQELALTGIQKCFPNFASAIRCYFSFCELRGCPPFPVTERIISERGPLFKSGAAFSNYVGYIRKICYFLEESLAWDTAAVKNVIAAQKLLGKGAYRFPNFLRIDMVMKILTRESRDVSFAQLFTLPFCSRYLSRPKLYNSVGLSNTMICRCSPIQKAGLLSPYRAHQTELGL